MTKHVNADSIICGKFCDIVKFFRGRDIDAVDRLAQRALTIIFKTDHLVQTGKEVDADPFSANMFASAALTMINRTLTTYPFLRESEEGPEEDEDAVFLHAEMQIESAERLLARSEFRTLVEETPALPALTKLAEEVWAEVDENVRIYGEMFGTPYLNAYYVGDSLNPIYGTPGKPLDAFDFSMMEHAIPRNESHSDVFGLMSEEAFASLRSSDRGLLSLTDGFLNSPAEHADLMAALERSEKTRR